MNPSRNYLLSCYWTPVARAWLIFFASSFQVFIDIDQIPLWAFSYLGCSVLALSTSPHRRATPDPSFYLLFAGVSVPPGLLGSPVFNRRMTTHAGNPWPNTAKNAINFFSFSHEYCYAYKLFLKESFWKMSSCFRTQVKLLTNETYKLFSSTSYARWLYFWVFALYAFLMWCFQSVCH